jgi:hypothetical protein
VEVSQILKEIDNEIARLQEARNLLAGGEVRRAGRVAAKSASPVKKRRRLSAEGRKKIADAMKRRWMERKKQAAAKAK